MGDRAGSVGSLRATVASTVGGSYLGGHPQIVSNTNLTIQITSWEIDPEVTIERLITSGTLLPSYTSNPIDPTQGVKCAYVSLSECSGGIMRATGFVDPTNTAVAWMLIIINWISSYMNLKNVIFYIDNVADTTPNRSALSFGLDSSALPTNNNAAKLVPLRLTGRTDENGMQEIEFELHSQAAPLLFANNL